MKAPAVVQVDLANYLNSNEISDFKSGKTGIFSISVIAQKPADLTSTCTPGGGCC